MWRIPGLHASLVSRAQEWPLEPTTVPRAPESPGSVDFQM
jgi:hypothetical protein